MRATITSRRDVAEQLRYHYWCHRQIDRTIKALERLQRIRETQAPPVKAVRNRSQNAA